MPAPRGRELTELHYEKRADGEGEAANSTKGARNSTSEEPDEPKTAEMKIYRREREKRKLRKPNDGGKLASNSAC